MSETAEVALAEDAVPTIDQAEPSATYRDWDPERTIVRTYFIGGFNLQVDPWRPVRWAPTVDQARAEVLERHGRIYEENHLPGRSYFRVGLLPTSSSPAVPPAPQSED